MSRDDATTFTSREPVPLEQPRDLRDYVAPIRLHKWIVLAATLLGGAAGWLLGSQASPSYASITQILVGPGIVDATSPASADASASISMNTQSDLATSRAVARDVRRTLDIEDPVEDVIEQVQTSFELDSDVLTLTFTDETPEAARDGAAAFADTYLEFRAVPLQNSLDGRREVLTEELTALQEEFDELTSQLEDDELTSGEILKIQADEGLLQLGIELVTTELTQVEALVVDAGTIVAAADLPTEPSSGGRLTKLLYGAVGLFLGLMFGMVFAYARESASDGLHGVADLEELLEAPVLGLVHEASGRTARKRPFLIDARSDPTLLQDLRAIRSVLLNATDDRSMRFLVTSSTAKDGRTTISASLASAIASSDKRVILVSADLHAPSLERLFGLSPQRDLVDLLEGRASLDEVLMPTDDDGLAVVPGRALPAEARGDLIESDAMKAFLDEAGRRADVVILDSPPLVIADPFALASQVDAVIYVADARRAKRRRVARARVAIEQAGGTIVGSVLNHFAPRRVRVGAGQYRSEYRQRRRYLSLNGQAAGPSGNGGVTTGRPASTDQGV